MLAFDYDPRTKMRNMAAVFLLAALIAPGAAAADDKRQVRMHLHDLGAERIRAVVCDATTRECSARYRYVDRSLRRLRIRPVYVQRCTAQFKVTDGVEHVAGGVWEYVEVAQYGETCEPADGYYRTARD